MSVQLARFADLTAFQRDILWVVYHEGGASYGLGIKDQLEETYEQINHGRLYPNLGDLIEEGLLEKSAIDKRTNSYELTSDAETLLAERQSWERGEER